MGSGHISSAASPHPRGDEGAGNSSVRTFSVRLRQ